MDNKVKIIVSFLIGILFFSSCAFDGDIEFYEIKINEWAKITYWFQSKRDTATLAGFDLYETQEKMEIDKRLVWDGSYRENDTVISSMPNRVVYNNDFIITDDGYENSESCKYYLIKSPERSNHSIKIENITRTEFDSIESTCLNCKVINNSKIQLIQYQEEEKEKNSFPTKTVIFLLLVIAYIFYRIRKKKKK